MTAELQLSEGGLILPDTPNLVRTGQLADPREVQFPGVDHWGLSATGRNPYLVYIASLNTIESRRAMAGCLDRIAALLDPAGPGLGQCYPWGLLRYEHTTAIRALLLTQARADGTPWSPAYVNKHLAALRKVLKTAWLLGLATADDYHRAAHIEDVPGLRLPAGRHVGADELAQLLLSTVRSPDPAGVRDAAIIAALYSTGCRREELAKACIEDYEPAARSLRIVGKGNKEREVYLQAEAARLAGVWLAERQARQGPLFCPIDRWGQARVRHLSPDAVGKAVSKRAAQAGLPAVTAHDLRRTFVGDLLDAGVDLATVQQLAGHRSSSTTAAYDRRPQRVRRAAVDRLPLPDLGFDEDRS